MDQEKDYFEKDEAIRHNLIDSFQTLFGVIREIEEGYRFDDSDREDMIRYLRASADYLQEYFYRKGILVLNKSGTQ